MSRKSRQTTNFFTTGDYVANDIQNALFSDAPADANPQTWTWNGGAGGGDGANIWRDLNSGRNTLRVQSGMTLRVNAQGRYRIDYSAEFLVRHALIVHKFDAFDGGNRHLFTFVTRPQPVDTLLFPQAQNFSIRGTLHEIDGVADLNAISYFVRRGGGKYRD